MKIQTLIIVAVILLAGISFIPTGTSDTMQTSFGYWKVEAFLEDEEGNQVPMSVIENQGSYLLTFFYEGTSFTKVTFKLQAKATGNGYDLCRIYTNQIRSQGYAYSVPAPTHECFFNSQYGNYPVDVPLDGNFHTVLSRTFDFQGTTCTKNLPNGNYKFETMFTGTAQYSGIYGGIEDEKQSTSLSITALKSFTISGGSPPAPYCGDGICNGNENCNTCPGDCGPCEEGEDYPTTAIYTTNPVWNRFVEGKIRVKANLQSSNIPCTTELKWGDGTSTQTISTSSNVFKDVYHTYTTAGTKTVQARSKRNDIGVWGDWYGFPIFVMTSSMQLYYTLSFAQAPIESYEFNGRYLGG
jgi:hypothetical protein